MEKIGIDLGFFQTKASDLSHQDVLFTSVVGTGFDSLIEQFNHQGIAFDNPKIVVGEEAIKYAKNIIRYKDDAWIESPACRQLFQAAMSELKQDSGILYVVVSLPISLYRTRREKLRQHLTGIHEFTRRDRTLQTIQIKLDILPQGVAALFDQTFDERGEPLKEEFDRLGVIDIGGRNTNILLTDNLRDIEASTESINVGCWTMIEMLQKQLIQRFDRPSLSEYAVEKALRTDKFIHEGIPYTLSKLTTPIKTEVAESISSHIKRLWPDIAGIQRIYLTGGGTKYVGETLCESFKQARIVSDPIFANARGAAKFARIEL